MTTRESTRPHLETPIPAAAPGLQTERLLRRSRLQGIRGRSVRSFTNVGAARATLTRLLARISWGQINIIDTDGSRLCFGSSDAAGPAATIIVGDDRAWTAVAWEGSIGLGRGYIEGWWKTDDPTTTLQILTRNLRGLDEIRNRFNLVSGKLGNVARKARPKANRRRNREDIATHYDLGNDFFRLFLDETMTYSAGVFLDGNIGDLHKASKDKYDRMLTKLGLEEDHRLLEIGTGWGGLALKAAEDRGCTVTTTTVSDQQVVEATTRIAESPMGHRIELLNRDWRDLAGTFDRIISIEMIEAVHWRDYGRFFATIERCLSPKGMVGLQAICVPDRRYERTKNTEDFIRRFIFPGGQLPSIGAITNAVARSTKMQVLDVEDLSAHYAETLRLWRERLDDQLGDVQALGLDDRFTRLWRFYLAYCEAGFLERHCTLNQFVLVGRDWRPDNLAVRVH